MDEKINNVGERNANELFKFYTLHQREVENSLKMSIYANEDNEHSTKIKPIAKKSEIDSKSFIEKNPENLIEVRRSAAKTKGDKILDRMAKACKNHKPQEFEYWDFGYQGRKQLKKSSQNYTSQNFKGIVDSIRSCSKNSTTELSKTPRMVIIKSTFHENMAKSRIDNKSQRDNESSDVKFETTYGHLLNYRLKSENSQKTFSFMGDRKSAQLSRGSPKGNSSYRFSKFLPIMDSTQILKGRKLSVPLNNNENKEGNDLSIGFVGPNLLKKVNPNKMTETQNKFPFFAEPVSNVKTVTSTE